MSRAPLKDTGTHARTTGHLREVEQLALPTDGPPNIDTVRALCHDLRQPLAAIMLLARSEGGDVRRRMDGILDQAQWLSDMVEGVIGDAAEDLPANLDVLGLASRCVLLARPTAACQVSFSGADRAHETGRNLVCRLLLENKKTV